MLPALPDNTICLPLHDDMSFDDWCELGRRISHAEKGVQWWVGDWWAFGRQRYGERAKAAAKGLFGRAFGTLANIGSVARRFETSRRHEVLSYQHHAEVAKLLPAEADRLLDEATENGWSTRDLRAAVSRLKAQERLAESAPIEPCTVADLDALIERGAKFGTIYADPPWQYDNQGTRAATGNHYEGMTVPELCALPIAQIAADDAHLHLWTTNGFLFEAPKIFEAWGFEFRSSFVWVKPKLGIGNYWRNAHEILLTGIRGNAKRFNDHGLISWLECDRGPHSEKPEQIRSFIERASPGARLELFGRKAVDGWCVWGNQVERSLFTREVEAVA